LPTYPGSPWCLHPSSSVTIQPDTLTFTPFDYGQTQPVTLTANIDQDDQDEKVCIRMAVPSEPSIVGFFPRVLVQDKDAVNGAAIKVKPDRLRVEEGQTLRQLRISLESRPNGQVEVKIPPFTNTDLTVSKESLMFTRNNYETPQWVDITAIKDSTADDEDGFTILHASGGGYDRVTKEVRVDIIDLDIREIIAEDTIKVQEGKTYEDEFGIILGSRPTGPVRVSISGQEVGSDLTLTPEWVNFTPQSRRDWNDWKWIKMIVATDTDWKDNEIPLTLTASGSDYNGIRKNVLIIIEDSDQAPPPGIVITPATVNVDEGSSKDFKVSLLVEPTELVKVYIPPLLTDGLDHNQSDSLEFTPTNYENAQIVTVTSMEDPNSISESEEIELSATGAEYDGLKATLTVNVLDKDSDGRILPSFSRITITEGTSSNQLTVCLSQNPTGTVMVNVKQESPSNLNEPNPSIIEFDASDCGNPKTIALEAPPDDNLIDHPSERLTLTASGGGYDGVDTTVTVTFRDEDIPEIIAPSSLKVPEGQFNTLSIRLSHRPKADVDVTISGTAGTDLSSNTTTLMFTDETWNTDKSVTLTAAPDDDFQDETITLTLSASNGGYDEVTKNVTVTIDDDDGPISVPSVQLSSVRPNPVREGATTTITATLSEAVSTPTVIQLDYEHIDTEPSDYIQIPSFTIDAGFRSGSGDLHISNDDIAEPDETFRIRLLKPDGVDLGTPSSIVVTINDDGDIPPPTEVILTVDRQSVLEGESVIVTVTLEKALNQAVVIPLDYSTDGVDATPEDDYIPLPELTIEAGKTVQSGSIQTLLDGEPENVETFTVAMGALPSEVVGGRPLSYTIMIVDQEPPDVSLSVDRNSVNEGEQINVTISLSRSLSNDVVIPLEVDPVSASESDYQILSTLFPEIASGQTDGQISIHAEEDRFIESPETFTVALSDDLPSSVVEGTPSSIVIKINDTNEALIDAPQSVVMVEGSEEKILVSLTAVPSNDVTVKITAMEQSNLEVAPTDLVFSADLRNQSFEVTLMATPDDNLSDDTIPLLLTASGGEYEGEEHKIDVTIIDSSQPGLVVPIAISITEGETGFFDVSLSQRPIEDVSVMILVPETPDTDLELLSSTVLTFRESNWDETQSVELMVREDPDAEPDDPVQITLNGSRGGYDGVTETVIVTIIEKDAIGIDVHPTFMRIVEEKTDELSVVLTSEPTADVEIRVSKQGDSVLRISTTPLTFTPSDWQTPQTIILKAGTDDNTMDDQEILTLRAVGGGYTGQQKQVPVTILERGPPTITIHSGRASEDEDVVRLAIELSHSTHEVVTVQYTTTDGTATAGEDYTSSRGIVIFDPGGTQGVVQFEIIPDTDEEGPETFIVTLSEPRKAIIDRAAATATIIDNDSSVPSIAIDDAVSSDNTGIMTFKIVLSQPYPYDITARYYTEDGTATAGQDYVASTGVVTFPSGSMQATIQVPVVTDDIKAQGETFFVHVEPTESLQMKKSIATAVIQQSVRTKENNALKAYTTRFVRRHPSK